MTVVGPVSGTNQVEVPPTLRAPQKKETIRSGIFKRKNLARRSAIARARDTALWATLEQDLAEARKAPERQSPSRAAFERA